MARPEEKIHLEILPEVQKRVWPELAEIPRHFVLYGGTAIALRFGHRQSVDFDFFTQQPIQGEEVLKSIKLLKGVTVIQLERNTLSVVLVRNEPVKMSFFGGLSFGRVGNPTRMAENGLALASLDDLFGHKLKVLLQRVEAKDYQDVAAFLRAGWSLEKGLGAAMALFKETFPISECLKALVYFEGPDLVSLTETDREVLRRAVKMVHHRITPVTILSYDLV